MQLARRGPFDTGEQRVRTHSVDACVCMHARLAPRFANAPCALIVHGGFVFCPSKLQVTCRLVVCGLLDALLLVCIYMVLERMTADTACIEIPGAPGLGRRRSYRSPAKILRDSRRLLRVTCMCASSSRAAARPAGHGQILATARPAVDLAHGCLGFQGGYFHHLLSRPAGARATVRCAGAVCRMEGRT